MILLAFFFFVVVNIYGKSYRRVGRNKGYGNSKLVIVTSPFFSIQGGGASKAEIMEGVLCNLKGDILF